MPPGVVQEAQPLLSGTLADHDVSVSAEPVALEASAAVPLDGDSDVEEVMAHAQVVGDLSGMGVPVASSVWTPDMPLYERSNTRMLAVAAALSSGTYVSFVGWLLTGQRRDSNWFVALIAFYVIHLIESLGTSGHLRFLCNREHTNESHNEHELFGRMRRCRPRFVMKIECYHMQTRTRWVTESYQDSEGKTQTREVRETYEEKVITYTGRQEKVFESWEDSSGPGPRLGDVRKDCVGLLVRVERDIEMDEETKSAFKAEAKAFVRKHRHRDDFYSYGESIEVDGFRPAIFLFAKDRTPRYLSSTFLFVVMSLLALDVPLRIQMQRLTLSTTWTLRKKVSVARDAFVTFREAVSVS
mmetsp:Transcript_11700/g.20829  ORF Transcript_11700/g.20829 Transcript_11700/m.20829 type:complete len:356 (+) Transcript_11700:456-1523(+)|eukprot:CAMPEP_0184525640 /NCGR_PEP_ID=MMETSP0198_2-20121128/10217_1 /TAXON_ID=1112570 /ORGANISM="Thraustochytrium sp., Strain LLF1b" /LENGTH=355 /DNA_ID=CAMNT_0026917135 /DNA_START=459 /DNA_END=1526 /DNA_ORIENTATION=-